MISDLRFQMFLLATRETGGWEIRAEAAAAEEGSWSRVVGRKAVTRGGSERERIGTLAERRLHSSRLARDSLTKGLLKGAQGSTKENKRESAIPRAGSRGRSYHPELESMS